MFFDIGQGSLRSETLFLPVNDHGMEPTGCEESGEFVDVKVVSSQDGRDEYRRMAARPIGPIPVDLNRTIRRVGWIHQMKGNLCETILLGFRMDDGLPRTTGLGVAMDEVGIE
jgi:hypothetical protein